MNAQSDRHVYFHVGALKTGSTHLQALLWHNRDALRSDGVLLPGRGQRDHFDIGWDIMEVPRPDDYPGKPWSGSLARAAEEFRDSDCHSLLISDERLSRARPEQIDRAVDLFDGAQIHVIYVVREFAGLIPSHWQENIKNGPTREFDAWLQTVRDNRGQYSMFWRFHDVAQVAQRWSPDWRRQVHILTLPTSRDIDQLWQRMQQVVGWRTPTSLGAGAPNASLGLEEAELLRGVQRSLASEDGDPRRSEILKQIVAKKVLAQQENDRPILIPPEHRSWISAENERRISFVTNSPVDLVGDVSDLEFQEHRFGTDDRELDALRQVDAATEVIADLATRLARAQRRISDDDASVRGHTVHRVAAKARGAGRRVRRRLQR